MAKQDYLRCHFVLTLFCILITQSIFPCFQSESSTNLQGSSSCIDKEREALISFKAGLTDPTNILSSWEGEEYCRWWGVACNNETNHVMELNLGRTVVEHFVNRSWLGGDINPSLLHLKHLRRLDLSYNRFCGTAIPKLIGLLQNLRYLNLSSACFGGLVPPQLGNLSRLHYLDLSNANGHFELHVDNLRWLSTLSFLKYLDLSFVNLTATTDWLEMTNMLPSLTTLNLEACQLLFIPSSLPYTNFTSLSTLDLGRNSFNCTLPQWIWNISSLTNLNLSFSSFHGPIPDAIGNLIGKLQQLTSLDLSFNQLDGSIPKEIGKLQQLTDLYLNSNSFSGVVSEAHLANLTRLKTLHLDTNSLTISVDESWVPSFQLVDIHLCSSKVGPSFPSWLQHQMEVVVLLMSSCEISGTVPEWFWNKLAPSIVFLDLSDNHVSGELPRYLKFAQDSKIYLRSNQFVGPLPPNLLYSTSEVDLSNNFLSGPLPNVKLSDIPLSLLQLSNNSFNSTIPPSLLFTVVQYLDLSNNNLSGEIPDVWQSQSQSQSQSHSIIINLANNHLSGRIPNSIGHASNLLVLNLRNNSMSGLFPTSLKTCNSLKFLDLSQNKFFGKIPTWLGKNLTYLSFLSLRSNLFSGNIPSQLVQLHNLKVLDLAENNLLGSIPPFLGNFTAMASVREKTAGADYYGTVYFVGDNDGAYYINSLIFTKGVELQYTKNRDLVKSIDLSDNYLSGEIPEEIGALIGLINLNLARNRLNGKIPETIGRMQSLESLDLSRNGLFGNIPQSISYLNSLSYLNLSYNHLSGTIPSGHQLQTLTDPSMYAGNFDLCGPPLAMNCSSNKTSEVSIEGQDDKAGDERVWLFYSIGMGYIVGVWAVCGILLFKKTWRYAYFQFIDNLYDWFYELLSLTLVKLKRARE